MEAFSIATDPPGEIREAPGGGRVLTPTIWYTPATGENIHGPAIVMITRGPGSNPARASEPTRWAAERWAAKGYTVVSLQTHLDRGYPLFSFDETAIEIDAALDSLEARGYEDFILAGSSYGAVAAAYYVSTQKDASLDKAGQRRVRTVVMLNPLTELRNYHGVDLAKDYESIIANAQMEFATGHNSYPEGHTIEVGHNARNSNDWVGSGNFVAPAEAMLDYWGPDAATRNEKALASSPVPILMMVSDRDASVNRTKLAGFKANAPEGGPITILDYPQDDGSFQGLYDKVADDAAVWLDKQNMGPRQRVFETLVDTTTADGTVLPGVIYTPEHVDPNKPAFVMAHGRSGDIIQSSTHWMGWRLAQKGYVVLTPSFRISGAAGIQFSNREQVEEDLKAWMKSFEAQGHNRIIMTGHSNGGIWISDYKALTRDPHVIGMLYMAPTANVATWEERQADKKTLANYAESKKAVEAGLGTRKVFGVQSANLMYDSTRPDSASHPERLAQIHVPGLFIIGGKDALFQRPGVRDRLVTAYKGKLTQIDYPDGTHGLRETKDYLADDIDAWVRKTFP